MGSADLGHTGNIYLELQDMDKVHGHSIVFNIIIYYCVACLDTDLERFQLLVASPEGMVQPELDKHAVGVSPEQILRKVAADS